MQNIEIKEYRNYNMNEVLDLYNNVGWINYTKNPIALYEGFKNSICVVGAFDNDKLIGLIRCVGDNFTIILIQDLLINTEYQNKGIGRKLLNYILNKYKDIYQIQVTTDIPNVYARRLYESCGFKTVSSINCCSYIKLD